MNDLDFSPIKKLNTKFIPVSEKSRQADLVFEIKVNGQTAYIYLFIEFQSTVDRFMALRMAKYQFEFYQEMQMLSKFSSLSPSFSILLFNGNSKWTALERFTELLLVREVSSMLETNMKIWEEKILEKGIEKGIEKRDLEIVLKMAENGICNADIRKVTGLSTTKIEQIKKKGKSKRIS